MISVNFRPKFRMVAPIRPNGGSAPRWPLALALLLATLAAPAKGQDLTLTDALYQDVQVEILPAEGDLLVLWPQDLKRDRPGVVHTLALLQTAGIEVWLIDPLEAAFLPRSNEQLRTLPGASVAALIEAALARSPKRILLLGHDRMALPLLRGLGQFEATHPGPSRLVGAVLLYPNLFGPAPAAGDEPVLDPLTHVVTSPLLILQPGRGSLRQRMPQVLDALWAGGSPAFVRLVPGVRDWYPMQPPNEDSTQDAATALLPAQLQAAADLLGAAPRGRISGEPLTPTAQASKIQGLVERLPTDAPDLDLQDTQGHTTRLADLRDSVTLVNFWATWCPPCVEEIPSMNRLAARYAPTDFQIVSVNFQEGAEQIREFMRRVAVEFPVLLDEDGRASGRWRVFAFPSSFLVDRGGRIRYSVNSAIPWDEPDAIERIDTLVGEARDGH